MATWLTASEGRSGHVESNQELKQVLAQFYEKPSLKDILDV